MILVPQYKVWLLSSLISYPTAVFGKAVLVTGTDSPEDLEIRSVKLLYLFEIVEGIDYCEHHQ